MTNRDSDVDVAIIGSGQGGGPLASACASAGRRTVLIEREHVGGTCVNEGCTPTKTMIASGRVAYLARRGEDYGVRTGDITIDMKRIRERKRANVERWRASSEKRIHSTEGLTLLMGEARFVDQKRLLVTLNDGGEQEISAGTIVINAGERPAPLTVEGADRTPLLDSTSIMELDEVPGHLLVVGGGYVGLEFAQLFRRLGSEVTIVNRGPQLMSREDPDIAGAVAQILEEDGITVLLNSSPTRVEGTTGAIRMTVKTRDEEQVIQGTHVLAATGRNPNTNLLALDKAGIETDKRGYIQVDDYLATNVPGIYAIGDITPGPKFTHISYDDYRVLEANLLHGKQRSIADRLVPYTTFIDPQLGRVGLSENQAREQGTRIRVASMPMSRVARAIETDEQRGLMKVVVDAETERILGAAILGLEGGEVMSMIEIAMMGDLPYTDLRDGIFAHPLLAEALNNLFFSFRDE